MIKAIIVDDEQSCIDILSRMIHDHFKNIEVLALCKTVDEGKKAIIELKPEIVFLDVEIVDRTGFDLLQELDEINFEVIFTTAHVKYALQAIKFSALDYIMKPCDEEDLSAALDRYKEKRNKSQSASQFEALFHNIKNINKDAKKIALPTMSGLEMVSLQDVIRLASEGNYTMFYMKNKQQLLVSKTIKDYEDMLKDVNFFRVHNSHIINLRYVTKYFKGEGGVVKMEDGSEIDVSRRRKDEFLNALKEI